MWSRSSVSQFLVNQGYNQSQLDAFYKRANAHVDGEGKLPDDKLADIIGCNEMAQQYREDYLKYPMQYQSSFATTGIASS